MKQILTHTTFLHVFAVCAGQQWVARPFVTPAAHVMRNEHLHMLRLFPGSSFASFWRVRPSRSSLFIGGSHAMPPSGNCKGNATSGPQMQFPIWQQNSAPAFSFATYAVNVADDIFFFFFFGSGPGNTSQKPGFAFRGCPNKPSSLSWWPLTGPVPADFSYKVQPSWASAG